MSKFETAILSEADNGKHSLAEPRGPILEALVATGRGYGTGGSYVRRGKDRPARCTVAGTFFRVLGYLSYLGTAYSRTTSTRKNRVLAYFLEPWNVLRWRWLSTWCEKFFKCFPTQKFVCIHQMKIFSWYGKNCTNCAFWSSEPAQGVWL